MSNLEHSPSPPEKQPLSPELEDSDAEEENLEDGMEQFCREQPLFRGQVNISVTGFDLKQPPKKKPYFLYEIQVTPPHGEAWHVHRRYSQFRKLHKTLKKTKHHNQKVRLLKFPKKKVFGNKKQLVAVQRKEGLEKVLQQMVGHPALSQSVHLCEFLSPFFLPAVECLRSCAVLEFWCERKSHVRGVWSASFAILANNILYLYLHEADSIPKSLIPLARTTCSWSDSGELVLWAPTLKEQRLRSFDKLVFHSEAEASGPSPPTPPPEGQTPFQQMKEVLEAAASGQSTVLSEGWFPAGEWEIEGEEEGVSGGLPLTPGAGVADEDSCVSDQKETSAVFSPLSPSKHAQYTVPAWVLENTIELDRSSSSSTLSTRSDSPTPSPSPSSSILEPTESPLRSPQVQSRQEEDQSKSPQIQSKQEEDQSQSSSNQSEQSETHSEPPQGQSQPRPKKMGPTLSADANTLLQQLFEGVVLLKYGRKGKPHKRVIYISPDRSCVCWRSAPRKGLGKPSPKDSRCRLSAVSRIGRGLTTEVLMKNGKAKTSDCVLSLVFPERTLDLECPDPTGRELMVEVFQHLLTCAATAPR